MQHHTEQQIECAVGRMIDRLDAEYMRDPRINEEEYHKRYAEIGQWAEDQYKKLKERNN